MNSIIIKKKKRQKIKVISLNLKSCSLITLENIMEFFRTERCDVICLQELDVDTQKFKHNLCQLLAENYGYYSKFQKSVKRHKGGYEGLSILSKHPILQYQSIPYQHFKEKRFMQRIKIFHPELNQEISIINTHLDYMDCNELQLQQLKKYTSSLDDPYFLVCGDLNITPFEIHQKPDPRGFLNNIVDESFTYTTKRPKEKLDYIIMSDGLLQNYKYKYIIPSNKLSDHKALVLNIYKNKKI